MNKNNKGFLLSEALVVSTILLTGLVFIYSMYVNSTMQVAMNRNMNTVNATYLASQIIRFANDYEYWLEIADCRRPANAVITDISNCQGSDIVPFMNFIGVDRVFLIDGAYINDEPRFNYENIGAYFTGDSDEDVELRRFFRYVANNRRVSDQEADGNFIIAVRVPLREGQFEYGFGDLYVTR